ncbi:MAG: SDR family oxidoreductase [Fidelibacterota bacterium]|nr:MAG: SDR family oxidoreductase [Candidatus Neomarinimicrobiota bacterium]
MASLKDKVVVITGASSGVGRAAALAFARRGAHIVLAARRPDLLETLRDQITRSGGQCLAIPTDVTRPDQVDHLFHETEQQYGRIDILVNSVGRGLKSHLLDIDPGEWQAVLETNLTSVFLCTRAAAAAMARDHIRGHIITVASIASLFGAPGFSAYTAAKHGVRGFLKATKWELRQLGIKTSAIYPARIDTAFFDSYPHRPPGWQLLSPHDVARYLVALASRSGLQRLFWRTVLLLKRLHILPPASVPY